MKTKSNFNEDEPFSGEDNDTSICIDLSEQTDFRNNDKIQICSLCRAVYLLLCKHTSLYRYYRFQNKLNAFDILACDGELGENGYYNYKQILSLYLKIPYEHRTVYW